MSIGKSSHPSNIELFKMEVKALQTLKHSKHVINMVDYFENDEGMFAVIDNAETKSLRDVIH